MRMVIWGKHAVHEAKKHGQIIEIITNINQLSKIVGLNVNHQDIAAIIDYKLYSPDAFLKAKKILIIDGVTDTGNLGSIIRSAAVFGWHHIVLSKKGKAALNGTVAKIASGGLHHVYIAIDHIVSAVDLFHKHGFQIVGIDERGTHDIAACNKQVLVVGDEHKGITCKSKCDYIWSIQNVGFRTLNVSIASSIAMYSFNQNSIL